MKGVKHIVFYGLPHYSQFYSELVNMIGDVRLAERKSKEKYTTTVIYSRRDAVRLMNVLGTKMGQSMIQLTRNPVQTLVTE